MLILFTIMQGLIGTLALRYLGNQKEQQQDLIQSLLLPIFCCVPLCWGHGANHPRLKRPRNSSYWIRYLCFRGIAQL